MSNPRLIALDVPGGPGFVSAVRKVWDEGDAFVPIDPRLPAAERKLLLETLCVHAVRDSSGEEVQLGFGRELEHGDALVVATSGTTGRPKGVIHTHGSLRASALATSAALGIDPSSDHWLACLPLAHIGGLSVVLRALITGTQLTVHDGFNAADVMRAADLGVTRVSLVTKALSQVDATRFKTVLLGGAAPPPNRPANCIATYGMTETGSGVVYERRALNGVELRAGHDGVIWVRGPMLFRAYRKQTDDIDPLDADGWFCTGDIGGFNQDGSLFVSGRAGEVIVTGGEKVWPDRTEAVLRDAEGVAEVAVAGRPHPLWGHEVVAYVVPVDPGAPPSLDRLRAVVKETLPAWYAPRALEIRESLPKTALGKVRRKELED